MEITCVTVGPLGTNCYVISSGPNSGDALLIDPGAEPERIQKVLGHRTPTAILLTHGHFDHTGALAGFPGVPVYIHPADDIMLKDPEWSMAAAMGDHTPRPAAAAYVQEGSTLRLAGMEVRVLHTPGHTPGSVCYQMGGDLFTGDTLFCGGYGRTDLPGGDFEALRSSLRRLMNLPGEWRVYPGHGASTTLEIERQGTP